MRAVLVGVLMFASSAMPGACLAATMASSEACAPDAIAQAGKLLAFHFGDDSDRMHIDDYAKPLPSIVNPANAKQRFDVLEVWGTIYKGRYRMRFEYYRMHGGGCVLMGQEVLEHASL